MSRLDFDTPAPFRLPGSNSVFAAEKSQGIRANVLLGLAISVLLVGGLGVWAGTTSLAGAVIASGTVVVESSAKKVQHQTGGIIGAINVREGDRVAAGDVLVRLDETLTRANLQIVAQQYDRMIARQARLEAERLGRDAIRFSDSLAKRMGDPEVDELTSGERTLFESRTKAALGLKSQLLVRAQQFEKQIEGLTAQRQSVNESAALVDKDYESLKKLYDQKLVSLERVSQLKLELSRLRGESGRLTAAIAETEGKISETRLQALQVDEEMRKDVNEELRELDGKVVELIERKAVAQDQLSRTEIKASQSGFVQELAVHTVGGVVGAGETLMLIVPEQDKLVIDAMVAPANIDDVAPGQPVSIRFSAFEANITPECKGTVQRVSADQIKDAQRQLSYFVVRATLADQVACLGNSRRLQPGMPAEVHIQTGERNVWSYVMKPLTDQFSRAFAE